MLEPDETWRAEEPRLVERMMLQDEGSRNTYFINFKLDYFDHGESKLGYLSSGLVTGHGPEDFNFCVDVLEQVQHIRQRPCYRRALEGFMAIRHATISTVVMFRHIMWKGLQQVTLVQEKQSTLTRQDGLWWSANRRYHESTARDLLQSAAPSSLIPGGWSTQRKQKAMKVIGPLRFEINFIYRWTSPSREDVDRFPCPVRCQAPEIIPSEIHQRCVERDREILAGCAQEYLIRGD
ncbi:hypothetical protein ONS96_004462 [Cadophora gregata f. sp. sojae]|nr:hypothetical protein ONS96_004462 [Cadophora gregata f. sp. sojae]